VTDPNLARVYTMADEVNGWLGRREGPYLYRLAKCASRLGVVVEIGSWQGKSTIWLAKGSESANGNEVYAIDPHVGGPDQEKIGLINVNTEQAFRQNIRNAGLEGRVIAIVKPSVDALEGWHRTIGMLWIDGDHSYEAVAKDFYGWTPFVVEGGVIALHDTYSWEGVRKLVDEEILLDPSYRVLGQVDATLAVQKTSHLTSTDRLKINATRRLRRIYRNARVNGYHWRSVPRKILRGLASAS
jgi:MMP 1-O-methyltransferase